MKKIIDIVLKVLLSFLMVMPILGTLGIFPAPTADMYTSAESFAFITAVMGSGYISITMAIVFTLALVALWTKRVALAALLILPLTVNIVGFHLFLDGGLFTAGSVMADVLLLLNVYFLWDQRAAYRSLLNPKK
jgi:hypothetical protein